MEVIYNLRCPDGLIESLHNDFDRMKNIIDEYNVPQKELQEVIDRINTIDNLHDEFMKTISSTAESDRDVDNIVMNYKFSFNNMRVYYELTYDRKAHMINPNHGVARKLSITVFATLNSDTNKYTIEFVEKHERGLMGNHELSVMSNRIQSKRSFIHILEWLRNNTKTA